MSVHDFNVIAVFDPDGGGQDFAYTSGLFAVHGVAELHVWSRPADGVDPGADWIMSATDCARLLNRLSEQAISGALDHGATWVDVLDGGFTEVEYTVAAETVLSPALDTFQLADDTPVRAVRFALSRPEPDASKWPMSVKVAAAADALAAELDAVAGVRAMVLGQASAAGVTSDASSTKFGVWSPVVDRLRRVVTSADSRLWDSLLFGALHFDDASKWALGVASAASRAADRSELVTEAVGAARDDASAVAAWMHEPDDPEFAKAVQRMLAAWLAGAYASVVVADVIEPDVLSAGAGWLFALADPVSATKLWCESHGVDLLKASGSLTAASESVVELLLPDAARSAAAGRGAPLLVSAELALEVFNASS